jgi:hypothetical protein
LPNDDQVLDKVVGEYQHSGGRSAEDEVREAIERVVRQMSWFSRAIARRRLRASNEIPQTLRIERDGERVTIAFDGRERKVSVGGPPISVDGIHGDDLRYSLEIRGATLVQRFDDGGSGRINEFRADGDAVMVKVRVYSDRLPKDVVYELRYVRAEQER